jgi:tRNA pseudouridine38-40 synthase
MRKVALKVAYIGNKFYGFQRQINVRTVEGELIKALENTGLIEDLKESRFSISGRTDRGVHALGNVVSFQTKNEIIINQINDQLADDVQILGIAPVHYGFNPRYANKRYYKYITVSDHELDIKKMQEAALHFQGTHDFSNFSKRSERHPVRTVDQVKVFKEGNITGVDVVGESFLWNMVRKMVQTLLDVGMGLMEPHQIKDLLNPINEVGIKPVPPEGLILMDVHYNNVKFIHDRYACLRFQSTLKDEFFKHLNASMVEKTMINGISSIYNSQDID